MSVRPATLGDNAVLLDLTRSLVLPGLIRFGVDRAPDFFALDHALDGTPEAMVVESGEGLAGFVDVCGMRVRVASRIVRGVQISLAGMAASCRGKGLFRSMVQDLEASLRGRHYELAFGLTNLHNHRAREFIAMWPHGCFVGEQIRLHVLLADVATRPSSPYRIRAGCGADLPRIDELVQAHRAAYDVAPMLPSGTVARLADLDVADFLVACTPDDRIVACVAVWDQYAWRRTPVVGYGALMRVMRAGMNGLCRFVGRARLPAVGEHFRFAHLAFPGADPGAEMAFAALLHTAAGELGRRGFHFLALGLPACDSLTASVAGFLRLSMTSVPFLAAGNDAVAASLRVRPTPRAWMEYALS